LSADNGILCVADAIAENQVDGKTLCGLADADLYTSVADGGLGLKPLQLKRVRAELAQYQSSDSSGNSSASELSMPRKSFQPELHETDTVYSAQVPAPQRTRVNTPAHCLVRILVLTCLTVHEE